MSLRTLFAIMLVAFVAGPGSAAFSGLPLFTAPYQAWSQQVVGDANAIRFGMDLDASGHPHFAARTGAGIGYLAPLPGGHAWTREEVYASGSQPDLALDAAGNPHMVFYRIGMHKTMYATRTPSGWTMETIDAVDGGGVNRIRVDDLGRVHVVYGGWGSANGVHYAIKVNGVWSIQQLASGYLQGVGLDLDIDRNVHVVFASSGLKYATNVGGTWQISSIQNTGTEPDIAIDATNTPHVAWTAWASGSVLGYAKLVSGTWNVEIADPAAPTGDYPSINVDGNGRPHIAYGDFYNSDSPFNGKTRYATKLADGSWNRQVVGPVGWNDEALKIRVDDDGFPRVAYQLWDTQVVGGSPNRLLLAEPLTRTLVPPGVLP